MFQQRLKREISEQMADCTKVLVGVSGGMDSMVLLHGLWQLQAEYGWELRVVHVNHQLRGEESEEDVRYVQRCCAEWGIPCQTERIDVQQALIEGGNKQALARQLRYEAFARVARGWGAEVLALAHHADDQAETILMRLLRGTGVSGLAGMESRRAWEGIYLVRPLLSMTRAEIEAYGTEVGLQPRQDSSNRLLTYTRNRIRHELIPLLCTYNPHVTTALTQLSEIVREEEQEWMHWVDHALQEVVVVRDEKRYVLDLPHFSSHSAALQRRMVKLILNYLWHKGTIEVTLEAVEQVRQLVERDHPSGRIELAGGLQARREYDRLHIERREVPGRKVATTDTITIQIPGTTLLPGFMGTLEAVLSSTLVHNVDGMVCDYDLLSTPLVVRQRRQGEKMSCSGLKGRKRVKDLFMEARIPQAQRDIYPIVYVGEQILWIPGVRRSDLALVTPDTKRYLSLTWIHKPEW